MIPKSRNHLIQHMYRWRMPARCLMFGLRMNLASNMGKKGQNDIRERKLAEDSIQYAPSTYCTSKSFSRVGFAPTDGNE